MKTLLKKLVPGFVFSWYHFLLVFLGALIYGFPSRKLIVIGVTGTNGKSTVVHLATEILEQSPTQGRDKPVKVASLSSIKFKIKEKEWKNMLKMTMPGRFKLQRFLRNAVKAGCRYAVLEITSEGIKQHRHRFIDFNGVVFTNLTREHLEAHKGFENYKKAKGKLFKALEKSKKKNKFSIINLDDLNAEYFLDFSADKKYTYGINSKKAETTPDKINLKISLPGEFNIYNSLAAVCVGLSQGVEIDKALKVLKSIKEIPGRMELIIDKPLRVFVDYAHTPDALEKAYEAVSGLKSQNSKLVCVLGSAGGGRDKWKRPEMGKIAAKHCDEIILTNEDPYNEDPVSIIKDVEAGFEEIRKSKIEVRKIIDRREAICQALASVQKNDVIIITGKGSEPWICVKRGKKVPWDDRKVVREEFDKIYGK